MNNQETQEKVGYRDILRQKEYMKIIVANLINRFGDSIDSIAFTYGSCMRQREAWHRPL